MEDNSITLTLEIAENEIEPETLVLEVSSSNDNFNLDGSDPVIERLINDYLKLKNKPSINGTELYDNYNEIDPTVPSWSKGEEPEKMGIDEIYSIWQSVFS